MTHNGGNRLGLQLPVHSTHLLQLGAHELAAQGCRQVPHTKWVGCCIFTSCGSTKIQKIPRSQSNTKSYSASSTELAGIRCQIPACKHEFTTGTGNRVSWSWPGSCTPEPTCRFTCPALCSWNSQVSEQVWPDPAADLWVYVMKDGFSETIVTVSQMNFRLA